MDDDFAETLPTPDDQDEPDNPPESEEIIRLRNDFQSRLIAANLRTEAVRAGMVDLDGLKLVDLSGVRLGDNDKVVGGRKLIAELRRNKPWLFTVPSTSSAAVAPASQPVRQKSAMEMSSEEYAAARTAVTRYQF